MNLSHLSVLLVLLTPSFRSQPDLEDTLIVLNKSDNTVSLIDARSGEAQAVLATGAGPHEVAVSPDGTLAVVVNYGHDTGGNTLTLIDLVGREVAGEIVLEGYTRPHGIQFIGETGRMLITSEARRALIEVDLAAGKVVRAIDTGADGSHMLTVAPDGKRAYVANIGSGSVSVIDLVAGTLLDQIPTGAQCEGIDVTPDGKEVWATNRGANTVSIIDTATLQVVAQLESSAFPIRVKVTPDGKRALVSCALASEICVYDTATRELVHTIKMAYEPVEGSEKRLFGQAFANSPTPVGILISPDGSRAYVANTNSNLVALVDLATMTVVGTIATGNEPDGLGWAGRQGP
jgi:YVTN family beta-propeller protein